jgi:putative cardiolipin synthase
MHSRSPHLPTPKPLLAGLLSWRGFLSMLAVTLAACATSLPSNADRVASQAFNAPEQTALGQLTQERRARSGTRSDAGFLLLDSAESAMGSRLALIDSAQRTLDLQYYAIHGDKSSETLLQRLRDAARRGVRVRVLIDDFNLVGKDAQVLRLAFEPNVQIRLFNPLSGSRVSLIGRIFTSLGDVERIQKRMHNKLFIADNAMGITGGRNLGDAYFGTGGGQNFLDLDVLAAGRVVRDMSVSFDRYWNDELAYPMQKLVSAEDLERLRTMPAASGPAPADGTQQPVKPALPAPTASSVMPDVTPTAAIGDEPPAMDLRAVPLVWAPSFLMVDQPGKIGPGDDEADAGETVVDGLLTLMEQARQDVVIVSPYFVPGPAMMDVFGRIRAKGVRVRVLTNSLASNDAPVAHAGYARYRKELIALGVELHEMRADQEGTAAGSGSAARTSRGGSKGSASNSSLHSKAVIIDGRLAVIGSMNLDLRSQRKNSEVALLIRSGTISQQLVRQFDTTIAQGAYRMELENGRQLVWRAPAGAAFKDSRGEPDATARQKLLVRVIGPFAPDEML